MVPEYIVFGEEAAPAIKAFLSGRNYSQVGVLLDENTEWYCFPAVSDVLKEARPIRIQSGEEQKNLETCASIWLALTEYRFDRKSLLINLGGGVIGDMGGFCASTYKRGIDFINVPTTLLAQVDASIGGKLGIDFEGFKNHIGLFREPNLVIVDPRFLDTLDRRELRSGFAEIIKHSLIADADYWPVIAGKDFENQDWKSHIKHSLGVKSKVVFEDPRESGLRKILNFGHTIGHAIETCFLNSPDQKLLHGEAISIGMICEAYLSVEKTGLSWGAAEEIVGYLLSVFGKPQVNINLTDAIVRIALQDKKNDQGQVKAALLSGIGKALYDMPLTKEDIYKALTYYNSL